jgi:hypothetical protein
VQLKDDPAATAEAITSDSIDWLYNSHALIEERQLKSDGSTGAG